MSCIVLKSSLACLVAACFALASDRACAQPINDECAAATPVLAGTPVSFDTTAATLSADSWLCVDDFGGGAGGDVWFTYTATQSGLVRFAVCIPPNDDGISAFLSAYTTCGGDDVACDYGDAFFSDTCSRSQARLVVAAGQSYLFRVAGYDDTFFDSPRPAIGTATVEFIPPAPNDTCANAIAVGEGIVQGDNSASFVDSAAPALPTCVESTRDVWYRYTATVSGPVRFDYRLLNRQDTFSPFFGGVITLLDACGGTELACGQEPTITAIAGQSYIVRVASSVEGGVAGAFPLRIAQPPTEASSDCAAPQNIGLGSHPFSTLTAPEARLDCGPNQPPAYRNVYFRYTAATTGLVAVTTIDADFAPGKNISTGCDAVPCRSEGRVALIDAVAGNSYLIHIFSYTSDDSGWAVLRLEALAQPSNDSCATPIEIVEGTPQEFSTLGATTTSGYPCGNIIDGGIKDIWYRYTATGNGVATFSTPYGFEGFGFNGAPDFGVMLSAFDSCNMPPFACATNQQANCVNCTGSSLSVPVVGGQVVLVRLAGTTGTFANLYNFGLGELSVTLNNAPPLNDSRNSAITLLDGPNSVTTIGSTTDGLSTCPPRTGFSSNDVWFAYTSVTDRLVTLVFCSTSNDQPLRAGVVSVIDDLTNQQLACSTEGFRQIGNAFSCSGRIDAVFNAVAGRRYLVRIAGEGGSSGNGELVVTTSDFRQACLSQPAGSITEPEPCGQQSNAGCSGLFGTTPVFQDLPSANVSVWATSRAEGGSRDIDWYRFTLTAPASVTIAATTEFPAIVYLMNDGCPFSPISLIRSTRCGETVEITANLSAGRFGVLVAHDPNNPNDQNGAFYDLPCALPNHYILSIDADLLGACCTPSGCAITTATECAARTGNFAGEGTVCPSAMYAQSGSSSTFEDISAGNTPLALSNNSGAVVDLGFTFEFFGRTYTQVGVSDNGYVAFGEQPLGVASNPDIITAAGAPANAIFAMWDDFDPARGMIYTRTDGLPGSRRFVASWQSMAFAGFTQETDNFQVVLFEGSNRIELRYAMLSNRSIFPTDVTVGIKDLAGFSILQIPSSMIFPTGIPVVPRAFNLAPTPIVGACSNTPCRADFNNDSVRNVQDIFDYIACFFAGESCIYADRNNNGTVTVQDLFDFITDWFTGCP